MLFRRIVPLVAALAFLSFAVRAEQSQKASRTTQDERVKKLEERADAAEKAASAAALEKDYIARTQKMYETYYQKTFNTQMLTLGIVGFLLIAVFGLVAKFSLDTFEQRTKLATADATAQMRNEYSRILAREVQKLWDSNAADNKKLKEALTTQSALLDQNLKDMSDFQIQFVQALAGAYEGRPEGSLAAFRQALAAYKSSKPRNLFDAKVGATTARHIFEFLQKMNGENWLEKAREELAGPLYNGLEEELALTALQAPWLTPLINERIPPAPEPQAPPPAPEPRSAVPKALDSEPDMSLGEEYDSCRLITT
jgi:hypothetical protein